MKRHEQNTVAHDVYQDIAEEYAAIIDSKDANAFYEKPAMLSLMPDVAGLRVLDAGCGPGVYSEWLIDHGASIVGIDYSEKMITLAKARTKGRGTFHVADLSAPLAFLSASDFDLVLCPLVLDYLRDWVPVLHEFNRVLKPDGRLLFSCQHPCFSRPTAQPDNYFLVRRVEETWGSGFSKHFTMHRFRRSLTDIINPVVQSSFQVDRILEPQPTKWIQENDPDFYLKLLKQPLFLCVLATKHNAPHNRTIEVTPYDLQWPRAFAEIRDILSKHLGGLSLAIEHVGSTSVPGLAAKPILDTAVVITQRDDLPTVVRSLSELGYFHQGDLGITGREAFGRRDNKVPYDGTGQEKPVHHLYVCDKRNPALISHIAFRNYLRQHPDEAQEYGDVKIRAAATHPHDINGYMDEKKECIERILRKAEPMRQNIAQQLDALDTLPSRRDS